MVTENTTPEWVLKYKHRLTRNELLTTILNAANSENKDSDVINDIGRFVVNSQKLENTLKSIISLVNSYHSTQRLTNNNKSYTVYRKAESLDVPMGKLFDKLSYIRLSESLSKHDLFEEFKKRLKPFVMDRNFYIHNILNSEDTKTILEFKAKLKSKVQELEELNEEAAKFIVLLGGIYRIGDNAISILFHKNGKEDTLLKRKTKGSKLIS